MYLRSGRRNSTQTHLLKLRTWLPSCKRIVSVCDHSEPEKLPHQSHGLAPGSLTMLVGGHKDYFQVVYHLGP